MLERVARRPAIIFVATINIKDTSTNSAHLRGPSHSLALPFSWHLLLVALTRATILSIYFKVQFYSLKSLLYSI